jgi:hypothetical protein
MMAKSKYRIENNKVKRKNYNEDYKVRRLKGITPKGYNGKVVIVKKNGQYVAEFYKKKSKKKK